MKNWILLLFLCLAISSCNTKDSVPEGIIPPVKMADIISDIYVNEYKSRQIGLSHDSSLIVFRNYELKTYADHQVSDSIYKKSFAYYIDNPKDLDMIYQMVIDSLSLREQVTNKRNTSSKLKSKNRNTKEAEENGKTGNSE